jgi:photosystem II stability/assembly factor-like uncharacterized protein
MFLGCAQPSSSIPATPGGEAAASDASRRERKIPIGLAPPIDPTRIVDDGSDYKQRRKSYVREMHRAAPDVDWAAIEAANGADQREKRNLLAAMSAGASRWTERGSNNQAGRMHVAVPAPDGVHLYAGSSRGGVWRGTLTGQDWTPLGDNLDGGAHWLAVVPAPVPTDPDIIVRATDGGQVHRSTDSGATWLVPAGLPALSSVRRVLTTADGSHTIFVVLHKSGQGNGHVYRSTDRGASFVQVAGMANFDGDLWAPRDGGGNLYMVRSSNCWTSSDNGDNWTFLSNLPADGDNAEMAGSEAGAPRLWVIQDEGGTQKLYRSDDAGLSWSSVTEVTDYWGTLNASITDVDLFAWGGVEVHRTTNGGSSFSIVNGWGEYYGDPANKLHADVPGIDVLPDGRGGEIWYVSTDGGLYESTDGLASVQNLSLQGLRVSQYYSTHTSSIVPKNVVAGSQDQGYQRADAPASLPDTTLAFDQLISGDYGHLTSSDGTHAWLYSVYPGFVLVQRKENDPDLYITDFPDDDHQWMPFIVADPYDQRSVFFCGSRLWRLTKDPLVFSWTPTQWSAQDFQVSTNEVLTAVTFSPVDPERAYAATSAGRLYWSDDHGLTWTQSSTGGPGPHYFYGTALVASATDLDLVYAGGSGYSNPAVYRSTDGGQSFSSWNTGLPSTLVYSLTEAPDGTLFAGTETSAYKRAPGDGAWTDISQADAPLNLYWSAETVPSANVIRFGTYGRGIWDYSLDDPCAYEPYGVGLGGTNLLTLDTTSGTHVGTDHVFSVTGSTPGANGFLIVGTTSASLPAFGGTLLVSPSLWVLVPVLADGTGSVALPLTVAADAMLVGVELHWQAAMRPDPTPGGWLFSNGLAGTLCDEP